MAIRTRWTWSVGAALVATATAAALITIGGHTRSADAKPKGGGACAPGSSTLLAAMPVDQNAFPPTGPTYPEGTAVLDHRIITSGPANFGTAGNGSPSQLTVFDRHSGDLLAEVPLQGEIGRAS